MLEFIREITIRNNTVALRRTRATGPRFEEAESRISAVQHKLETSAANSRNPG
jgi:hypothetical protein